MTAHHHHHAAGHAHPPSSVPASILRASAGVRLAAALAVAGGLWLAAIWVMG
ncbi:MAG: hypothetical protein AB7K35_17275 [Pseudorhodoplanes sp.]